MKSISRASALIQNITLFALLSFAIQTHASPLQKLDFALKNLLSVKSISETMSEAKGAITDFQVQIDLLTSHVDSVVKSLQEDVIPQVVTNFQEVYLRINKLEQTACSKRCRQSKGISARNEPLKVTASTSLPHAARKLVSSDSSTSTPSPTTTSNISPPTTINVVVPGYTSQNSSAQIWQINDVIQQIGAIFDTYNSTITKMQTDFTNKLAVQQNLSESILKTLTSKVDNQVNIINGNITQLQNDVSQLYTDIYTIVSSAVDKKFASYNATTDDINLLKKQLESEIIGLNSQLNNSIQSLTDSLLNANKSLAYMIDSGILALNQTISHELSNEAQVLQDQIDSLFTKFTENSLAIDILQVQNGQKANLTDFDILVENVTALWDEFNSQSATLTAGNIQLYQLYTNLTGLETKTESLCTKIENNTNYISGIIDGSIAIYDNSSAIQTAIFTSVDQRMNTSLSAVATYLNRLTTLMQTPLRPNSILTYNDQSSSAGWLHTPGTNLYVKTFYYSDLNLSQTPQVSVIVTTVNPLSQKNTLTAVASSVSRTEFTITVTGITELQGPETFAITAYMLISY